MPKHDSQPLTLSLPARPSYLRVATHFAESSASAYGLGEDECLKLSLAVEEIFLHLCSSVCPEQPLELRAINGIYYTRVLFLFASAQLDMKGLNIATTFTCADGEADLAEMGLMLASRSVDHLHITVEKDHRICLAVTKEKAYPGISAPEAIGKTGAETGPDAAEKAILVETPDPEHLKLLAVAVCSGNLPFVPAFFRYPGKVVDMVSSGDYRAVAAFNDRGRMIGGALFRFRSEKIVEIYGPYLSAMGEASSAELLILEDCVGRIARTKALGVLSLSGLPPAVRGNFEYLGSLVFSAEQGGGIERPSFYRHLHEDPGCEVWTHADFAAYLRNEHDRLILARDIRIARPMGETKAGASLFAADINRDISEAVLRPVWPGGDLNANVERHVCFLRNERFLNIFFKLDLGVPWHAELMPPLAAHGFKPRLLIPFGGKADVLVFQL